MQHDHISTLSTNQGEEILIVSSPLAGNSHRFYGDSNTLFESFLNS